MSGCSVKSVNNISLLIIREVALRTKQEKVGNQGSTISAHRNPNSFSIQLSADSNKMHFTYMLCRRWIGGLPIVVEPKSRIVQKHNFFAPERYMAGFLHTDSLNSA